MQHDVNQRNKQLVYDFWRQLDDARGDALQKLLESTLATDHVWHGPAPIDDLRGAEALASGFWRSFHRAFPNAQRRCHIVMGGASSGKVEGTGDGHSWVGGTGVFDAVFESDYLGIPSTGKAVAIRWGEFCKVVDERVVATFFLIDLVDLMEQAGFDVLPRSRGKPGVYPPPAANDGVMLDAQDPAISKHTLAHIRDFIFDGLNGFDQSELESMGMADYFHPDVKWYGPGGIGACASFHEFEDFHQKHWLHAYPDRQVQDLDALFAEGPYSAGPGWKGVVATHTGEYLDVPATGKSVWFNGIDFWKLENDRYVENWVFVDMIDLYRQFGIDLFERLKS